MNLLVLPVDGLAPVVRAMRRAKESIRITIFRCDLPEIEKALAAAAGRGVAVNALIAQTNRAGEKQLRKLEQRLLGYGITVSRTADDLVRYHDKFLVVDDRVLFVCGFNFTRLDLSKRRSFAVVTRTRRFVSEAIALFEADATRQDYTGKVADFVVSPLNARARLEKLISKARESLRIYDPSAVDPALLRLLKKKADEGVDVRILGIVGRSGGELRAAKLPELRVHVRAILRDDRELFIGSQGLRTLELDRRRELGLVLRERGTIKRFRDVFEEDWESTGEKKKDEKKKDEKKKDSEKKKEKKAA
jgi:cardiolipin synthase